MWATERFYMTCWARWLPAAVSAAGLWLAMAPSHAAPPAPSVDALPRPAGAEAIDLGALAERLAADPGAVSAGTPTGPQLLVFVSLSMPPASLRQLSVQAAQSGAILLLRGLHDGSVVKTAAALRAMIGQSTPALQIDPRQFARYGVVQVPTFVLLRQAPTNDCNASTCAGEPFATVSGDVTVDFALERLASGAPAFAKASTQLLQRLRRQP